MLISNLKQLNIDFLTTLKGVVCLLKDPGQTDSVYDIEEGLINTKANHLAVEYVKSQPGVAEIIQERYIAPPPDTEKLLEYPEDSLGYVYASFIKESGFDPNFYRQIKVKDDISYIFLRIRQTHDIWHLVTGFNTDVTGELGLKAFELAQTRRTMAAVLIAGGLLKTLFSAPEQLDNLLDRLAVGYRMGAKAQPFLAQKWEENWGKSLSEWRTELGVNPTLVYIP
ncbi:MAG TPA: Coq4 family protein [Leptolyngbyaceae cyanobacterium]